MLSAMSTKNTQCSCSLDPCFKYFMLSLRFQTVFDHKIWLLKTDSFLKQNLTAKFPRKKGLKTIVVKYQAGFPVEKTLATLCWPSQSTYDQTLFKIGTEANLFWKQAAQSRFSQEV